MIFLPVSVLLYHVVPKPAKNAVLILLSLLFYAWGTPKSLIFLLVSVLFNYLTGLEIGTLRRDGADGTAKIVLISSAAADIILLCVFKYVTGQLPLGISFYTFSVLSYLFDIWQGRAEAQKDPMRFLLYVSLFVKVASGPIVQYAEMEEQLAPENRPVTARMLANGMVLFLIGLGKKVLLADRLGAVFQTLYAAKPTVLSAWLAILFYGLQLYFDFSGYSDMAVGTAQMFGFRFAKNFDYPYCSKSVAEFWRRWHISLGNWFKQYVYFPMGGSRVEAPRLLLNLAVVWILTGIWHGNTLAFVFWGIWHGVFVILDKFVFDRLFSRIPGIIRTILTVIVVLIGWTFFFTPGAGEAFARVGNLIGIGTAGFADRTATFALTRHILLLLIAAVGCTPLPQKLYRQIMANGRKRPAALETAVPVVLTILLFGICIAEMLSSTYSSFLYFAF